MSEAATDDYEDDYDSEVDSNEGCSHCSGEGVEECTDGPLCCRSNCRGGEHDCISCGGSGRAEDQRIW